MEKDLIKTIEEILAMQKVVMMEYNGRPDCKNCSLAEVLEEAVNKYKEAENV